MPATIDQKHCDILDALGRIPKPVADAEAFYDLAAGNVAAIQAETPPDPSKATDAASLAKVTAAIATFEPDRAERLRAAQQVQKDAQRRLDEAREATCHAARPTLAKRYDDAAQRLTAELDRLGPIGVEEARVRVQHSDPQVTTLRDILNELDTLGRARKAYVTGRPDDPLGETLGTILMFAEVVDVPASKITAAYSSSVRTADGGRTAVGTWPWFLAAAQDPNIVRLRWSDDRVSHPLIASMAQAKAKFLASVAR